MDGPCRLRPASVADLPALAELERASFSDPWTPAQLREALSWGGALALVAEGAGGGVQGYLLGRVVVDEAEILSIATAPAHRREGIGRRLLRAAMDTMVAKGAHAAWLEVRVGNQAAREMYHREGFVAAGLRKGYYRNPEEDALVLRRDLTGPAVPGTEAS
ncbi:MAG: ribosomal protein S18-alanine N-acetyltransferase [Gemmatimonadota bacterium]